jgi:hypothetical protein
MTKSTAPRNPINIEGAKIENLRPENPFFKNYTNNKNRTEEYLIKSNKLLQPNLINQLPAPKLINQIPNFESKGLINKLNELDIDKWDNYRISKKVSLEKPGLKLDSD